MTHGIRIQLFKVRSLSLQFARELYSELRKLYSLDSDSIRLNTGMRGGSGPASRRRAAPTGKTALVRARLRTERRKDGIIHRASAGWNLVACSYA